LAWHHIVAFNSHRKNSEQKAAYVSKDQDSVLNAAADVFTFQALMPGMLFCKFLKSENN